MPTNRLVGGWTEPPTGSYVVRRPGQDDLPFEGWGEALQNLVSNKGYAVLINPKGKVIVAKGTPPEPDA
jgi:hypothetical protein